MTQKTLRVDAQLADRNLLHGSPLARGECAFAHSFLSAICPASKKIIFMLKFLFL